MSLGVVLLATGPCGNPQTPTTRAGWIAIPSLGVQMQAPADSTVQGDATTAFVSNSAFKVNLFVVDQSSAPTAAEQRTRLDSEPGAVSFTRADAGATTWRFDYTRPSGTAGTVARIAPGRPLDCGVHNVTPAVAAAAAAACATVEKL